MRIEEIIQNPKLISIDTRTIKKGDIFVAVEGKQFDGHDFVREAFRKGASAAVVSKTPKIPRRYKKHLIRVKDTVEALGETAKAHRRKFNIPVVAITGSNGKTTAKDLTSCILSSHYNVLKSEASYNNLIGLPLTLFKLDHTHDAAVLEMGMNHPGEIGRLSEIAMPTIGIVTNISPSHIGYLKTLENIFAAKSELLKALTRRGKAILNADDPFLRKIKSLKAEKVYFGIERECRFQAKKLSYRANRWFFSLGKRRFRLPLLGRHNIYNALIAIAVSRELGIDFTTIKKKLFSYTQNSPMRLASRDFHGIHLLNDSYNSNPTSMRCAIDTLRRYDARGKKIVVSGDMMELGEKAKKMHQAIGRVIASSNVDVLVTLGRQSLFMHNEAKKKGMTDIFHAELHCEAAEFLKKMAKPGDVILFKGSRGMEMEKIIKGLGR